MSKKCARRTKHGTNIETSIIFFSFSFSSFFFYSRTEEYLESYPRTAVEGSFIALCQSMFFEEHTKKPGGRKNGTIIGARAITRFTKRPFDSLLKGFYALRLLSSSCFNRKTCCGYIYGITARL